MKKKVLALIMAGAMTAGMLTACGGSATSDAGSAPEATAEATEEAAAEEAAPAEEAAEEGTTDLGGISDDPNTLTVAAWDANFNIPALEAAAAAYKTKNPDFKLEINTVSGSSDVENAVTNAA